MSTRRPRNKRKDPRRGRRPTPRPIIVRHWIGSEHTDQTAISLEQARQLARELLDEDLERSLRRAEDDERREDIEHARSEMLGVIDEMTSVARLDYKPDIAYSIELLVERRS